MHVQIYKRVALTRTQEEYQLWGEFAHEPKSGEISACLEKPESLGVRLKMAQQQPQLTAQGAEKKPARFQGWKFW